MKQSEPSSCAELASLPTIVLLAPPRFSKTETLNRWRTTFKLLQVARSKDGTYFTIANLPLSRADASDKVTEWLLPMPSGPRFRIIDVPGELVAPRRDGRDDSDGTALQYREALESIIHGTNVVGVLLFLRPAVWLQGHRAGRVGTQRLAYRSDIEGDQSGAEEVEAASFAMYEFLKTWFIRLVGSARPVHVAVQFGFADLIAYGDSPAADEAGRQRMGAAYQRLERTLDGLTSALMIASPAREDAWRDIDHETRNLHRDLIEPLEQRLGRPVFAYTQCSRETDPLRFPVTHRLTGLIWMVDRTLRGLEREATAKEEVLRQEEATARIEAQDRAHAQERRLATIGAGLLGLVVALVLVAEVFSRPSLLGPLTPPVCRTLQLMGEHRCDCAMPLRAQQTTSGSLAQRFAELAPHLDQCIEDHAPPVEIRPALVSRALSRAILQPKIFCSAELDQGIWTQAEAADVGAPLASPGELAFGQWLLASVKGTVEDTDEVVAALKKESASPQLLELLSARGERSPCLAAWARARKDGRTWTEAHKICREAKTWEALGPALQQQFAADALPTSRETGLSPLPPSSSPPPETNCKGGQTLASLAGEAPPLDGQSAANLAAMAANREVYQIWASRASGSPAGQVIWLRLADPGPDLSTRIAMVRVLRDDQVAALQQLFSGPWVAADSKELHNGGASRPARVPRLRVDGAAGLATGLLSEGLPTAAPFTLARSETPDPRVRLAALLLDAEPASGRNEAWLRARALAELPDLAQAEAADRQRRAKLVLNLLLELGESSASDASLAIGVACDVAAEALSPTEVLSAATHVGRLSEYRHRSCLTHAALRYAAEGDEASVAVLVRADAAALEPNLAPIQRAASLVASCKGLTPPIQGGAAIEDQFRLSPISAELDRITVLLTGLDDPAFAPLLDLLRRACS